MRQRAAYLMFGLSSLCKALGKLIITRERRIIVDALTLPGWFIVDDRIVCVAGIPGGFEWRYWQMPNNYIEQLDEMKRCIF
jgi:hypothetical protein